MRRNAYLLVSGFLMLFATSAMAQTGEISGTVKDATDKSGIMIANVAAQQNGKNVKGTTTDLDGNFTIKPLKPGKYDILVSYVGYAPLKLEGVVVDADKMRFLDLELKSTAITKDEITIIKYKVPLIEADNTANQHTITSEEIERIPTRSINTAIAMNAGVFQRDEGDGFNSRGQSSASNDTYINGVRVVGSASVPQSSIDQITTITGGVPAKYGDATGAIVNITLKNSSLSYHGGVEVVSSEMFDKYGYNLIAGSLTGPVIKKNKDTENERSFLGFFLAGEARYQKDGDPSAIGMWKIKDDVLGRIEETPLAWNEDRSSIIRTGEQINRNDMEKISAKQNVANTSFSISPIFDFNFNEDMTLSLGGTYAYSNSHRFIYTYSLFNPENNPQDINHTVRGYIRFTQSFGSKADDQDAENTKRSLIQDPFYTVQLDYTRSNNTTQDDTHQDNIFDYGYVGEFKAHRSPFYSSDISPGLALTDSLTGFTGITYLAESDTLLTFKPGTVNEKASNYTSSYYELTGAIFDDNLGVWTTPGANGQFGFYENINQIAGQGALVNGTRPINIYSMYFNTGRQFNSYAKNQTDQFTMRASGGFDIKGKSGKDRNKHSIEFGIVYEQRVQRSYSISPMTLYQLMNQLTNDHIEDRDLDNPYLIMDGDTMHYSEYDPQNPVVPFFPDDTIWYDRKNTGNQGYFDRNLRDALGLDPDGTDNINIHEIDPETFSVDMFSANELLNSGNTQVFYTGYDYKGNKLKNAPAFEDFFSDSLNRPMDAFRPIYSSFWAQDKFAFKDLIFNVGLRIDRYDANQKVLKDKYLLYPARTAGEVDFVDHPETVGDDFVVYVDDFSLAEDNISITGYRDGDTWYNSEGTEILNPQEIAAAGNSTKVTPYLVESDPTKLELDVNSFKDYEPQLTFMPRIGFSFPITDEAQFVAHYDVLTQRPTGNFATPFHYYYLNTLGGAPNPDLKPERTIDYQIGFRQKVSPTSAIKLAGFYREFKDQMQSMNLAFAYPFPYNTVVNGDFGTVKGFELSYDLRRTGNVRLTVNYTLQFAEGTGSSATSSLGLVSSGIANLRAIFPYGYDQRHTLTASMDYRYKDGKEYNGPKIGKNDIFSNAGANILLNMGSGTPYSQQSNPTPDAQFGIPIRRTLEGSFNGARLPWNFRMDLRIDKDFVLKLGRDGGKKTNISMNVYVLAQNLLNTKNVIRVYRYTGTSDDDGYLASGNGQQTVNTATDPFSFVSLYNVKVNDPNNYSLPRRMRLGTLIRF